MFIDWTYAVAPIAPFASVGAPTCWAPRLIPAKLTAGGDILVAAGAGAAPASSRSGRETSWWLFSATVGPSPFTGLAAAITYQAPSGRPAKLNRLAASQVALRMKAE